MIFLAFLLMAAWAQGPQPLSEEQAVAAALRSSPDLLALRQKLRAVQLTPQGIGTLESPQVRLGFTDLSAEFNDPERTRNNVGLSWSPPRLGELRSRTSFVRAQASVTSGEIDVIQARLTAEVRLLHRTLCVLEEQLRVATEIVTLRERILQDVNEQVRAGVKTALDRSMAEMALAEARPLPDQLRGQHRLYLIRLSQKIGIALSELAVAHTQDLLQFRKPLWERGVLRNEAMAARGELKSANANCEAASLAVSSARRELHPWVSTVQLIRRTSRLDTPGRWGFQINVEVPVFRWRESGVAAANADLATCRLRVKALEASISAEIEELLVRMDAVAEEISLHRRTLLDLASKHVELARQQLAAGQSDRVDVALTELQVLTARQSYLSKLLEFQALEIGLRQAVS